MRYYVYVDTDGTVTWSPSNLNELYKHPRDAEPLMNSARAVSRTQTALGDGATWELVGAIKNDHGTIVVTASNRRMVDARSLEPETLHEVSASGVSTRTGIRRGANGFEPIDSGAEPVRPARPRPVDEATAEPAAA